MNRPSPSNPIKIVTLNAPVSSRVPESVAGMLGFLVGVAEIVADLVAVGLIVIVADGVAVNAGKPSALSAANTVNVLTTF